MHRIKVMLKRVSSQTVMMVKSEPSSLVQSPPNDDDLDGDDSSKNLIMWEALKKKMFYLEPLLLGSCSHSNDSQTWARFDKWFAAI